MLPIVSISISENTKCAVKDSFRRFSYILFWVLAPNLLEKYKSP